jgi:hypothetical protein
MAMIAIKCFTALSAIALLAGCNPATTAKPTLQGPPRADATPLASNSSGTTAGPSIAGIILEHCAGYDSASGSIDILNAGSGKVERTINFATTYPGGPTGTLTAGGGCANNSGADDLYLREQFDRNFSRTAVMTDLLPDGSQHVGFISLANGRFTDLSGTPSGSFSSHAARDDQPIFSPNGTEMWFMRDGKDIYSTQLAHPLPVKRFTIPAAAPTQGGFLVTPGSDRPVGFTANSEEALPSPSGTRLVAELIGTPGGMQVFRSAADTFYDPYLGGNGFSIPTPDLAKLGLPSCDPMAWIDDRQLICGGSTADTDQHFVTMRLSSGSTSAVVANANLIPPNERSNTNVVVSPDKQSIAFLSTEGSVTSLYEGKTSGGAVRKIADVAASGMFWGALIGWY